jgi:hypothetical protein
VVTALALGGVSSGCLSNQYQVSRTELSRLATLPPEGRGQQVAVVQKLGNRRAPAIDPRAPGPPQAPPGHTGPSPYDDGYHGHSHVFVGMGVNVGGGGGGRRYRGGGGGYGRGRDAVAVANPVGPASGAAPAAAQPFAGTGATAQPLAGGAAPAAGAATANPVGGGINPGAGAAAVAPTNMSNAAKGARNKDDLAVLAAVAVALAAFAVVGMAFTEGARFDGQAAVSPQQLVYLQAGDTERPVPLALLTEADLAGVEHGVLRDDEGYGLVPLARAPLNRKGFAFKFDFGAMTASNYDLLSGFASHIGAGYFPHHRFGLLVGASLGGVEDLDGNYQARHAAVVEAQFLPVSWRRLNLGIAGNVGSTLSNAATLGGGNELIYGGAALMEIAITTRLAFTARYDFTRIGDNSAGPYNAQSFALGLAIY